MARLRNVGTGVVISVDDEKVERMGSEWELADQPKKAPAKKAAAKKSES